MWRPSQQARIVPTVLVAIVVLLAAMIPHQTATVAAAIKPDFYAWNLRVDFETGAPRTILTRYSGLVNPPTILDWNAQPIACTVVGTLIYQNGRAIFDGSSFLHCPIPAGTAPPADQCEAGAFGNWWFSAEAALNQVSAINPIIRATDSTFYFSLPSTLTNARTQAQFPSQVYQTSSWPISSQWNEVLIGQNGPMIRRAATDIPNLLDNLDPGWEPFFQGVTATQVGHRMFSPGNVRTSKMAAATIPYSAAPPFVDIGYNELTGAYFTGTLAYAEVDPPGCTAK